MKMREEIKMTNTDEITPVRDIITSSGARIATVNYGKEKAAKRMVACTNALKDVKDPKEFFTEFKNLREVLSEVVRALEQGSSIKPTSILGMSLMMAYNEENAKEFIKNIPYESKFNRRRKV